MKILAGSLGRDIHVAGVLNFLDIAKDLGHETLYLGPANSPDKFIEEIEKHDPQIVAVSYRLSPETAKELITKFKEAIKKHELMNRKFLFGGTAVTAEVAEQAGIFDKIFIGGESKDYIVNYLSNRKSEAICDHPDNLIARIKQNHPVLRHHFGLPSLKATIKGVKEIANAGILDVISIAPDQDAQEHFFHPDRQNPERKGDGGVPIRTPQDLKRIYQASRCGNYPLLRCYAGTNDLIKMAEMYVQTINNAWCAIPLTWYSVLDGRSQRTLEDAIVENQQCMQWHAEHEIPVEVNEAHQWSLRRAPDTIAVAMAYIAAYNAKQMGVNNYVSQYMFNTPGETSPIMDLGKMLAKVELIESLHNANFRTFRQVRSGLLSFPADPDLAKGQLASSIYLAMSLNPDIVHVVGSCEGHHAANPQDIIESTKIVKQTIKNCRMGGPDMRLDSKVQARKRELKKEAWVLLHTIKSLGNSPNPLTAPSILYKAVKIGLLDAPDLKGNKCARGNVRTKMIDGACRAVDPKTGNALTEKKRIEKILSDHDEN